MFRLFVFGGEMKRLFLILLGLLLLVTPVLAQDAPLTPDQIRALVLGSLPGGVGLSLDVYYTREVRETVAGELVVGSAVTFNATAEMAIGQTGTTSGVIVGYLFSSSANTVPASLTGTFNRADWATVRYIIRFARAPGNIHFDEVALNGDQFQVV
jgi:uncharacterized membrane protein